MDKIFRVMRIFCFITCLGSLAHPADLGLPFFKESGYTRGKCPTSTVSLLKTGLISLFSLSSVEPLHLPNRGLAKFSMVYQPRDTKNDEQGGPGFYGKKPISKRSFLQEHHLIHFAKISSIATLFFNPLSANSAPTLEENASLACGVEQPLSIPKMGLLFNKEKIALFTEQADEDVALEDSILQNITLPELPTRVDLSTEYFSRVFDQGNLGACTANAIIAAVMCQLIKQNETTLEKAGKEDLRSRLYLYWCERKIEGCVPEDAGGHLIDGLISLLTCGVCRESTWPYDISTFTYRQDRK